MKERYSDNKYGYLFISPWLIGFFGLVFIPIVYSLYLAFTDYAVLNKAKWIGLDNFIKMFTADTNFWLSFKVTLKFAIVQIPLKLVVSLLVAVVLARQTKLTGFYRVAFYIPSLLGGSVAVAMTWKQLWNQRGVVNQILEVLHLPTVNWLNNPKTALYVLVLLGVWQFGSQMLVFLAAIKEIPDSLHEAAIIDGAGPAGRFLFDYTSHDYSQSFFQSDQRYYRFQAAFNSAYLITAGGPMKSTLYYGLYQYQQAFKYLNMGYASAMAWFLAIVIIGLTALVFRSQSAWVYYEDNNSR